VTIGRVRYDDGLSSAGARSPCRWTSAQRSSTAGFIADALIRKGALKSGVSRAEAADLFWTLTASDIYVRLVSVLGRRRDRYTQWLGGTFCDQILPRLL
jgi:hypothetical protein